MEIYAIAELPFPNLSESIRKANLFYRIRSYILIIRRDSYPNLVIARDASLLDYRRDYSEERVTPRYFFLIYRRVASIPESRTDQIAAYHEKI